MPMRDTTRKSRRTFVAGGLASAAALVVAPRAQAQDRRHQMEVSIRPDNGIVTLINISTVEPENQDKLIGLLQEGTETVFSKQPGYISSSFHKSKDGRRVVTYAQWKSPRDIEAYRTKPEVG